MRLTSASLLGLLLLVSAAESRAGVCGVGPFGITLPGTDKTLPRNGHILVDMGEPARSLFNEAQVTARFVAAGTSTPAKVVKRLQGGYSGDHVQLLLAPSVDLAPNTAYHLAFNPSEGSALDGDKRALLGELNQRSEAFAFTTLAERDDVAPKWRAAPSLGRYSYGTEKGSTSDNSFKVTVPLGKDFTGFVLAHVVPVTRPGPALDVLFAVSSERTRVGAIDCYSMFAPGRGVYRVELVALDLGGNEARAPGKPLPLWFPKG